MSKLSLGNFEPNRVTFMGRVKRGMFMLLTAATLVGGPGYAFYDYHFNTDTYQVSVDRKYERSVKNGDGTTTQVKRVDVAIPGDPDGETFNVEDTYLPFDRTSGDRYRALRENGEYQVEVKGWRIPFFSMFKNVIDVRNADGSPLDGSNWQALRGGDNDNRSVGPYTPPPGYVLVPIEAIQGLTKDDIADPAEIERKLREQREAEQAEAAPSTPSMR